MANTPKTGENMPEAAKPQEHVKPKAGPRIGEKGEYLPSEPYKTLRGNLRKDL